MRDFLKKFLSSSLLAGTVFIFSKILGIWGGLYFSGANFSIDFSSQFSNMITVNSDIEVNSILLFSNIIFIGLIVIAGALILSKTIIFNDLTRSPRILVKVIHMNLSDWLEDGQSMYPKLFAWNIFLWMGTILVTKDYLNHSIPLYLPVIIGFFAIFFTYKVFNFLESHISDMISYTYDSKAR